MTSQSYQEVGVRHRRFLHQNPELWREEFITSDYCKNEFIRLGYKVTPCFETGFYADLTVASDLPTVAFRADMDALPAQEAPGEVVCSKKPGAAHLCGHDLHMAIGLTAAAIMVQHRSSLRANVRFLFQPSEEMFRGGAQGMIDQGCLEGVSQVFGLHNDPQFDCGKIMIREGVMSSNGDQFKLTIEGKSAHASAPHLGQDALSEAVRLLNAFKAIVTDRVDPNQTALISTCMLTAGEAPNILARKAVLEGSIRSFNAGVHQTLKEHFLEETEYSRRRGFNVTLEMRGYPAINNHTRETQQVIEQAGALLGAENVVTDASPMVGSEDFSLFIENTPGAFFFLGSGDHARGINNPLHSNPFIANEACIILGAQIFARLVGVRLEA